MISRLLFWFALLWTWALVTSAHADWWQNPATGRMLMLPEDISAEVIETSTQYIAINSRLTSVSLTLHPGSHSLYDDDPSSHDTFDFVPNGELSGYPIQSYDDKREPREFHIDVDGQMWGVKFYDGEDKKHYRDILDLFQLVLPSMKPLDDGEDFLLLLPWTRTKINLGRDVMMAVSSGTGIEQQDYDGGIDIRAKNFSITLSSEMVAPEFSEKRLQHKIADYEQRELLDPFKKVAISGRPVWKAQSRRAVVPFPVAHYTIFYYLVVLKNRIWTIRSSVYVDDDGRDQDRAKRIDIIEQLVAALPDNPPEIAHQFTNAQTGKTLALPDGWGVIQSFHDGRAILDRGIVRVDDVSEVTVIDYQCDEDRVGEMQYWSKESDYYRKIRYGGREAFIRDDGIYSVYAAADGKLACELLAYNIENDRKLQVLAEKLFATGAK